MALPSLLDSQNDNRQFKAQMTKELKIVFAEGCFDDFEGTQEELQEIIADLHQQLADGTLFENSVSVSYDEAKDIASKIENKMTRH